MNFTAGIPEEIKAEEFLSRTVNEFQLWQLLESSKECFLIIPKGFEERSLGVVEGMASRGLAARKVITAEYPPDSNGLNDRYSERYYAAVAQVSLMEHSSVLIDSDGEWLEEVLQEAEGYSIIIDITALSNCLLYSTLDTLVESNSKVLIAYTEAKEYWPTEAAWNRLRSSLAPTADIGEEVDRKPWLFGQDHEIGFVIGHEGFETAAAGSALIGFLPFKCARLAAITSEFDFSSFVFITGKPRLPVNEWRLKALKEINARLVGRWRLVEISTFGYREAFRSLFQLLSAEDCSLLKYNVHIAILGSKLQNVACWAVSRLLPEITLVYSTPLKYYSESFSDGIGISWGFPLERPCLLAPIHEDQDILPVDLTSQRGSSEVT